MNKQLSMFDTIEPKQDQTISLKQDDIISPNRCRTCTYIYNHQYGKMKYCKLKTDKKTSYGHAKVRSNDRACELYEKKNENK